MSCSRTQRGDACGDRTKDLPILAREKNEKCKRFWSFVKSLKKDASGITSLRENRILKTDTVDKANICNKQIQSAFTRETDSEIPSKGTSPFTPMGEITVPQTAEWAKGSQSTWTRRSEC